MWFFVLGLPFNKEILTMKPSKKVIEHVITTLEKYNQWYGDCNEYIHSLSNLSYNHYNHTIHINGHKFDPGFITKRKISAVIRKQQKNNLALYQDAVDQELISNITIFQPFPKNGKQIVERIKWLDQNDITEYFTYKDKIAFTNDEDALAYKLMWEQEKSEE
jgi:hypothetical protein